MFRLRMGQILELPAQSNAYTEGYLWKNWLEGPTRKEICGQTNYRSIYLYEGVVSEIQNIQLNSSSLTIIAEFDRPCYTIQVNL